MPDRLFCEKRIEEQVIFREGKAFRLVLYKERGELDYDFIET